MVFGTIVEINLEDGRSRIQYPRRKSVCEWCECKDLIGCRYGPFEETILAFTWSLKKLTLAEYLATQLTRNLINNVRTVTIY
jgi:hypothetical protein